MFEQLVALLVVFFSWFFLRTRCPTVFLRRNVDARQFLVSGSDSGVFKVWDLRMVKRSDVTPITESDFHRRMFFALYRRKKWIIYVFSPPDM